MQVTENDTVILYYSHLSGDWPDERATLFARSLPYAKRLATDAQEIEGRRTLAGVSLARRALAALLGRDVPARDFAFPEGGKPHVAGAPDFSIAHSGLWVGCAAVAMGRIGFDVEIEQPDIEQTVRLLCGPEEASTLTPQSALARWVATEAALKAFGASVREAPQVEFRAEQGLHPARASQPARAFFRGEPLHGTPVDAFEGAAACIMTSRPIRAVDLRNVPLTDLF
jgi:phosphopantetheinyl transferase